MFFRTRSFHTSLSIITRPSYVVPFKRNYIGVLGSILYSLAKNHNRPKEELHRSPWVKITNFFTDIPKQCPMQIGLIKESDKKKQESPDPLKDPKKWNPLKGL